MLVCYPSSTSIQKEMQTLFQTGKYMFKDCLRLYVRSILENANGIIS